MAHAAQTPQRQPLRRSRLAAVSLSLAALFGLLTACGSDPTVTGGWSSKDAPPRDPMPDATLPIDPPPSSVDTETTRVEVTIVNAYRDAVAVANDAFADPTQGSMLLADRYADPQLSRLSASIEELAAEGIRVEFAGGVAPIGQVVAADIVDDHATIRVCLVDDAKQVRVDDGSVVNADEVSSLREVTLIRNLGVWKISDEVTIQEWPNLDGCGG